MQQRKVSRGALLEDLLPEPLRGEQFAKAPRKEKVYRPAPRWVTSTGCVAVLRQNIGSVRFQFGPLELWWSVHRLRSRCHASLAQRALRAWASPCVRLGLFDAAVEAGTR